MYHVQFLMGLVFVVAALAYIGIIFLWRMWCRVALFPVCRVQLTQEVQQLKASLREERRKNEKLQLTLEIEKEANAQAQRVIEGIRNLDTSDGGWSDGGGGHMPTRM